MIPFPEVRVSEKTTNYYVVEKYLINDFWLQEHDGMFADDITADFPYAPPGMIQHMTAYEFLAHRIWLRNTVKSDGIKVKPVVIPTTDPNVFWGIRWLSGNVYWAKKNGYFDSECITLFVMSKGKINHLQQFENPLSYYKAIGITLPTFEYDPIDTAPSARMPQGGVSSYPDEENLRRAIINFTNPIEADFDEPIYTTSVIEVCPYAPHNMPEVYSGKSFDVQAEWMFRACPEWNTPAPPKIYHSTDPDVIVIRSDGYGRTTWSHAEGHYLQRELQVAFLDKGKIKHFRVYFNPLNKFASMNLSIPTIPYFNF